MKNFQTTVTTKDLGDGAIEAVVADESVDRDGEQLLMKGLDVSNYKKNPVVQWAHDYSRPPIGKADQLTKKADGSLVAKVKFAITESDFAKEIYALYKGGFLNAFSIGFLPKEAEGNVFTKSEMLEFSAVPVPANANALVTAKAFGLVSDKTISELKQTQTQKGAISGNLPINENKDATWDSSAAIGRVMQACMMSGGEVDWAKFAKAHLWVDPEKKDQKGGYKLPIADMVDGKMQVIYKGMVAAMAALNGSRGGVNIPDGDRQSVYAQIKKYYTKFGEDAPELKSQSEFVVKVNTEQLELAAGLLEQAAGKMSKEIEAYKNLDRAGASPRQKRIRLVRVKRAAQLAQSVTQSANNLSTLRQLNGRSIRKVRVKTK